MIIALIILLSILGYSAAVGLLHPYYGSISAGKCKNCVESAIKGKPYSISRGSSHYNNVEPGDFHKEDTWFQVIAWPVTLPYLLAETRDPNIKRGRAAIKAYWDDKAIEDRQARLKALEAKAGM